MRSMYAPSSSVSASVFASAASPSTASAGSLNARSAVARIGGRGAMDVDVEAVGHVDAVVGQRLDREERRVAACIPCRFVPPHGRCATALGTDRRAVVAGPAERLVEAEPPVVEHDSPATAGKAEASRIDVATRRMAVAPRAGRWGEA